MGRVRLPRFWFRTTFRHRWRAYVGLVLLLGITGGLSLFALAGARRTQSTYHRYLKAVNASTMAVDTGQYDQSTLETIAAFPEVRKSQTYVAPLVAHLDHGKPIFQENFEALASLDGRFFEQDRFVATQGRLPNPRRTNEVAVNAAAAKQFGYSVGQKLMLGTFNPADFNGPGAFANPPDPVKTMRATVVGIGLFPNEVLQDDTDVSPLVLFTPAYTRRVLPWVQYEWQGLTLKHGDADVAALKNRYVKLLDPGAPQFFRISSTTTFHVLQAVRPLSIALGIFGGIMGLTCFLLVLQALARQLRGEAEARLALRAMGATPRGSTSAAALGLSLVVIAGVMLAVLLATAASPLMPLGKMHVIEVAPGFDFDGLVLGAGALVLVLALGVATWIIAWRTTPRRQSADSAATRRPSKVVGVAQRIGLPATAVVGLRLAVEPGRGRTAVPVRSVMSGVAIAVLALVAAMTFGSSLTALVATPRLYGWAWDATLLDGGGYGETRVNPAKTVFARDTNVAGYAGGYFGTDDIEGISTPLLGVTPGAAVHPPILKGRPVAKRTEVVVGSRTLSQLHKRVGDSITLGSGPNAHKLRIVGTATLPTIGIIHGEYTSLGVGAMVDSTLVPGYTANLNQDQGGGGYVGPNVLFVKFRRGVDKKAALKKLQHEMGPVGSDPGSLVLLRAQRPAEIVNATEIGSSPKLIAGALGVAALASLGLALATSVRRRRFDLAVLKTLGFTRRQLAATVRWQAGATVLAGLIVGVPSGVIIGHVLWRQFAQQLDVVPQPSTPFATIAAISVAAIIVALVAAAIPARAARRVRSARLLDSV